MTRPLHRRLQALEEYLAARARDSTWPQFRAFCMEVFEDPIAAALLESLAEYSMQTRLSRASRHDGPAIVHCLKKRHAVLQLRG